MRPSSTLRRGDIVCPPSLSLALSIWQLKQVTGRKCSERPRLHIMSRQMLAARVCMALGYLGTVLNQHNPSLFNRNWNIGNWVNWAEFRELRLCPWILSDEPPVLCSPVELWVRIPREPQVLVWLEGHFWCGTWVTGTWHTLSLSNLGKQAQCSKHVGTFQMTYCQTVGAHR